ncbi:NERD domain-containing protein [Streptomyces decoyicus]|uniref:nuclease-related domain-containing protein n=1 Tax=Streptomyces decoyicus TaxID=249567 RepID=UPI002F9080EE
MTAGASADAQAAVVGRGRLWQRALRAVGVTTPGMAKAQSNAARWQAGAEGERRTAQLLTALAREGWYVLYDLAVGRQANVDALLVGPDGQAFTLDTKLWSARYRVRLVGGRLMHGDADRDRQVDTALWETGEVSKALGVPVTPLVVVHNAPVDGGGFHVRGVAVFPAGRLLELLRHNAVGRSNPREARRLVELAEARLPPYVK